MDNEEDGNDMDSEQNDEGEIQHGNLALCIQKPLIRMSDPIMCTFHRPIPV